MSTSKEMQMPTKNFSNYESLLTFTRASGGHALRPVSYGPELVTNGDFSTDSDWTKGTGWSISGGQATHVTGTGSNISQSVSYGSAGTIYALSVDVISISGGSGSIQARSGGSTTAKTISGNDGGTTVTLIYVHDGLNTDIAINAGSGTSLVVDNVSVKEVLFDQPDGTLTLFEHPNNVPRVEYDADSNRLGLLVEEARTNLVTYSEDFSNWGNIRSTTNGNTAVSPDGTLTADALVGTAVSDDHAVETSITTTAQPYTFSAFIKAGDKSFARLWQTNDSILADFDLTNLTVGHTFGSPTATTIEDVGNGWRRCSITMTPTAGTRTFRIYALEGDNDKVYLGDGSTEDIYIWGAQVEAGSFPTSYIKTTGSTATRSADVASIPVADFGYNQSAGTVLVEASVLNDQNANDRRILEISDGTTSNFFSVYQDVSAGENISIANQSGGSLTANFDTGFTITEGSTFKAVATLKDNDVAASVNGGSITSDTSTAISSALSEVNVGYLGGGTQQLNGHIKSIKYYPRRLSNAQLVELTS